MFNDGSWHLFCAVALQLVAPGVWGVHHGMTPGTSLVSPGLCHLGQASPDVGSLAVSSGQATRVEIPRAVGCVWLGTPGDPWGQRPQGWAGEGSAGS